MIRHDIDFCKNERRFMPLNIFHLNRILFLMIPFSDKTCEKLEKRLFHLTYSEYMRVYMEYDHLKKK